MPARSSAPLTVSRAPSRRRARSAPSESAVVDPEGPEVDDARSLIGDDEYHRSARKEGSRPRPGQGEVDLLPVDPAGSIQLGGHLGGTAGEGGEVDHLDAEGPAGIGVAVEVQGDGPRRADGDP